MIMKAIDESFVQQLQKEALNIQEEYKDKPISAMETRFNEEWWAATPSLPTGSRDIDEAFGKKFKKRLIEEAIRNRDLGAALIGYITGQVLNEVQALGLDLAVYRLAIAVLIAIIYRAAVESIQPD
jgi:hypothetical protein